jgi:hypothetical protein
MTQETRAQVVQQEAVNARAQSDLQRYTILAEKQEISKSDLISTVRMPNNRQPIFRLYRRLYSPLRKQLMSAVLS